MPKRSKHLVSRRRTLQTLAGDGSDMASFDFKAGGDVSGLPPELSAAMQAAAHAAAAAAVNGGFVVKEELQKFAKIEAEKEAKREAMEMAVVAGYKEWISLVAKFTVSSFKQWKMFQNSIHYLIGLWARFVLDLPSLQGDLPKHLDGLIPGVSTAFVQARLELVKSTDLDGSSERCERDKIEVV